MRVYRLNLLSKNNNIPKSDRAILIGNFDGIHLGRQKLINKLINNASNVNLISSIILFSPHTKRFISKNKFNLPAYCELKRC